MSAWWRCGFLLAYTMTCVFMGWHVRGWKDGMADAKFNEAQQAITIAAEKNVITTIGQQQTVTQGVSNAYESKKSAIDSLYAAGIAGLQQSMPAASACVGAVPGTSGGPHAATARPFRTEAYRLNAQECDENTAQLYGLQEWVRGQTAIKPPQ